MANESHYCLSLIEYQMSVPVSQEIITSDSAIAVMLHSHNNLFSPSPISFLLLSAVPPLACYSLLSSLRTVR